MKLSAQSHNSIVSCIQQAFERQASSGQKNAATDFHLQPVMSTGELYIWNDDEEMLSSVEVKDWSGFNPEEFYLCCERALKKVLNQLRESGELSLLPAVMPYSFVLVDDSKETIAELLLVDKEETLILSDELLKGLDEELNAFLKDLLEN